MKEKTKNLVILTGYFTGESYGLLGPQMAATIINVHTDFHSTPLIIHHASGLADWIRQIESSENIEFQRLGTTIGWWQTKDEFLL
ncbi:hypothetical protein [Desulfobacula sp.]